jgi:murein tripeptide amidase MpaA
MTDFKELGLTLFNQYDRYKENSLSNRFFKHRDLIEILDKLRDRFSVVELGKSVQHRSIHLVTIGSGKTKVLLWSQMHGDEPTATMALADILKFFSLEDNLDNIKKELLDSLTIYFIPEGMPWELI